MLAIANTEGKFLKVNPAWTQVLGYSEEEMLTTPFYNFMRPEDVQRTNDEVNRLAAAGAKTFNFKNRYRTKSGAYRWLSWSSQTDPDSGLLYCVARDITVDFELAEAEKKNLTLRKEKEVAEASTKQKEVFLANMSHEIRTPMNGIVGLIDMLVENTDPNPLQLEYLETVKTSSNTLMNIINDILDYSKLEAGKVSLTPDDHNIHSLVHQVKNLFKPKALEKDIEIISEYANNMPEFLVVDNNRFNQVLSNFVSNAIKFCNDKSERIRLNCLTDENDEYTIKTEIVDEGQGLSKEDQKKLFKSFSQLDNSSTKSVEGTGLGLAIAKQISELMGGSIGVESEIDKGSNFWFTFKAGKSKKKAEETLENNSIAISKDKFDLKVLLVDDKNVTLIVARSMLMKFGCIPETAVNGVQAVEKFEEGKYDLILMNIQMPEMDGVQATQKIKEDYNNIPPIIALTANAMEGDKQKYITAGLDDYLAKPITLKGMQELLNKWFPE